MATLTFSPAVPNGIYLVRSHARNPANYLEWHLDNEIRVAPLNPGSDIQKWKVAQEQDDTYKITNVASGQTMSIKEYTEDGKEKYRLFAAPTDTTWTLEPRGDAVVIGVVDNFRCVDLAVNDWVILWERNNLTQQRWFFDIVQVEDLKPPGTTEIPPGAYNISNRATDSEISVFNNSTEDDAPVLLWPATYGNRDFNATKWDIKSSGSTAGGLFITNNYYAEAGSRYLKEGAFVNKATHICYLVHIEFTDFYYIATDKSCSRVLQDFNPKGSLAYQATVGPRVENDFRQMWQFKTAH